MNSYETLLLSHPKNHVLQITLNRPAAANAFNTQMAQDLVNAFEAITMDPGDTRVLVLTGSGDRAFCAGGDLKERNGMSDTAWGRQHLIYERMARAILNCPTPIIGVINGAAYGGGCELVAAVDFAYVAEGAKFAQTEVKFGIIPGAGGTQTLARAIGERRAKELILTGQVFDADQALDWGLANAIYPLKELMPAALATAQTLAENAPIAVRQAKQAIGKGRQMSLADGLSFEIEAYNRTIPSQDRREGVKAFNEKRKPNFSGF
ncbi:enoyl-CoA hydratase-related protein [Planktomarina sp.]|jgi:enoyl-CoA hydratase/carnithine racemase|nr:enoyl-CoA hydratase-related protein [Planktomarina sp.]|tara:strand:+ start:9 stop:800 length:792 start_codon:yes stop_codon:yes gene_type:complete